MILDDDPMSIVPSSLGEGVVNRSTDWLIVNEAIKETSGSNDSLEMEGRYLGCLLTSKHSMLLQSFPNLERVPYSDSI